MDWTEATINQLRALWLEGHSSAQIGKRMGISKNAVIGKARRLELPSRGSPIKHGPQGPTKPRAPRITLPPIVRAPAPVPYIAPVRAIRESRMTCQYILTMSPLKMCDEPATMFRPDGTEAPERGVWCCSHRNRVYQRVSRYGDPYPRAEAQGPEQQFRKSA